MIDPSTTGNHFQVDDVVDITFRKAEVVAVYPDGSIEVQTAGPRYRVHPGDIDTTIDKLWSVKP
jgi:hypothetical protein